MKPPEGEDGVPPDPTMVAAKLLESEENPIVSVTEYEEVTSLICENRASSEDKWRVYGFQYKVAWGLIRLDAKFLAENGTQAGSSKARLLSLVLLFSDQRRPRVDDVDLAERSNIVKVPLVKEIVVALGLKSPFDVETVVEDLENVFRERMLTATEMFSNYEDTSRLFRSDARPIRAEEWDLKKIVKAINMVLGSVGLSLEAEVKRTQVNRVRTETRTYRLERKGVETMMELVNLRLRTGNRSPQNLHAMERMMAFGTPKYDHLIAPSSESVKGEGFPSAYAFIEDDE
jgi:hypothetical protein